MYNCENQESFHANSSFNPDETYRILAEKYKDNPAYQGVWEDVELALACSSAKLKQQTTCGEFATEKDAEIAFDSSVNLDFFYIEKEVKGRRLFDDKAKKENSEQNVRIDRILHPLKKAFEMGWVWGPIAVEIKKSNITIGPIFTQILEYRQSVFISSKLRNTRILPLVFAIFPSRDISCDLHSLQENQIILSCYQGYGNTLRFGTYGKNALELSKTGILIGGSFSPNTTKGHRGREK